MYDKDYPPVVADPGKSRLTVAIKRLTVFSVRGSCHADFTASACAASRLGL